MQYGGLPASSYGAATLKRRERSPSPQSNKRRVPPTCSPALYAEAAPDLSRGWSFDATETTAGTSSQRSSPGLDWLRRTQDLHLETPPLNGSHPLAGELDQTALAAGGADSNGDVGMDNEQSMHVETAAQSAATAQPPGVLYQPTPVAPHHAPPLHRHLAGSPQQDRQTSRPPTPASGVQSGMAPPSQLGNASFGLAGPVDWGQQPRTLIRGEDADMMDDAPTSPKRSGGWKVTMGYRADCIKCLQRVPGHYSHVVPS
ncbi:hypothetical protein BMF94_2482 [Rhodotorula taiwanensis]|uniref:Uncharacterized protein n=1 Tax=Rhodotorula taiwanensis TaxID=741276 RepID=A0A2S5BCJ8_9BASI|nr:hypothetical protein BMF94_2482 [Rhodotorula taiwanensis]